MPDGKMSAAAVDILSERCTFCWSGIGLDAERGTSMSSASKPTLGEMIAGLAAVWSIFALAYLFLLTF